MTSPEKGILYIATGPTYIDETLSSARKAKQVMDCPITLISDESVSSEYIDTSLVLSDPEGGTADQITAMERTPYKKTLYLDTDIYLDRDPSDVFDLLDRFDIAVAHAPHRKTTADADDTPPPAFPEYNTGVIGYRKCAGLSTLLDRWDTEYKQDQKENINRNQPSFRRALYGSEMAIATLPPEYNCRFQLPGQASLTVKVFHGRLQSVDRHDVGMAHLMDVEDVAAKINAESGPRVFYPSGNSVAVRHHSDALFYRLRYSIRKRGLRHTLKRMGEYVKNAVTGK